MTKELLIEIFNKRLIWELFLTEVVYIISWLVVLQLAARIAGLRLGLNIMLPAVFLGSLINLFLKPFLTGLVAFAIMVVLLVLFLKAYGKVRLIQAFWTSFLTLMIIYLGTIVITSSLCSLDQNIASFFLKNPYGNIVGTLIETFFPGIALLILSTFNVSMVPPLGKKIAIVDFVGLYLFGALFYWVYNSLMRLLASLKYNPEQILMNLVSEWVAATAAVVGYYVVHTSIQKQREYERRMFETEKTELLNKIQELADLNKQLNEKNFDPQGFIDSIGIIINKLHGVSNMIIRQNKPEVISESGNSVKVHLSPREIKIIEFIVQGKSNKEIAAALDRSEGGIKNIITKILDKLGLDDRIQLAVFAVRSNLVNKK